MNCNVVGNTNCSLQFLREKCHLLLKHILTNRKFKGKTSKSKSSKWANLLGKRILLRALQPNNHHVTGIYLSKY